MKEEMVRVLIRLENPVVLLLCSECLTVVLFKNSEVGLVILQAGSPADEIAEKSIGGNKR